MRIVSLITAILLLFSQLLAGNQASSWIDIPLDFEPGPQEQGSFIPYAQPRRPKIALALSGGGARGMAQIGVLKTFEKYGITIDGIAGTSIGAVVGGLYAVGYNATEIETLARQIDWNDIIHDTPPRKQLFLGQKESNEHHIFQIRLDGLSIDIPSAYTSGHKLSSLISDLVLHAPSPLSNRFDRLHIPFCAVCTDLYSGKKVVLSEGSLIDAIRASMAIPLLFSPVELDTMKLMDGGILQNLPVHEAGQMDADFVIAVDTSSKLRSRSSIKAPWEIADQVTTIMQQETLQKQIREADLCIQPDLGGLSNTDFQYLDQLIAAGEAAAEMELDKLSQIMAAKNKIENDTVYSVKQISISGLKTLNQNDLLDKTGNNISGNLSKSQIIWLGRSLFQTGFFSRINASLNTVEQHLVFNVTENPVIQDIRIIGNTVFSDSLILNQMQSRSGSVMNVQLGRLDLKKIRSLYHKEGYVLAHIDTVIHTNGLIHIFINEGKIKQIHMDGNDKTRDFIFYREMTLKQDQPLREDLLKQSIDNIYSTGYFSHIRFTLKSSREGHDLFLHFTERPSTLFRAGSRYDNERRTCVLLQLLDENILGYGVECALTGIIGQRDQKGRIQFRTDRLLKTYITGKLCFSWQDNQYAYYKDLHSHGQYKTSILETVFSIGQQMRRLGTVSLQLASQGIHLRPLSGLDTPEEKFTLRHITIRSEVDTRDRIPFARKGKHHVLQYETAGRFLDSDVSYFKLYSSMESFYPITKRTTFRPRFRWGTSDLTTPFVKQFQLGGLDSFIGLPEQGMVGKRFFTVNAELIYQLPFHFMESYLSIRYDLGGIWGRYARIEWSDFKHGIGAIFSVNTRLGPVYTGWGRMSDGFHQFYLSAGFHFQ